MGLIEESAKIKKIMKNLIREVIEEETKPCFRVYKAKVTSAPNGETCGIQLIGDSTEMNLPYSSKTSNVAIGDFVWVATLYNSFSNAIIWETVDFK